MVKVGDAAGKGALVLGGITALPGAIVGGVLGGIGQVAGVSDGAAIGAAIGGAITALPGAAAGALVASVISAPIAVGEDVVDELSEEVATTSEWGMRDRFGATESKFGDFVRGVAAKGAAQRSKSPTGGTGSRFGDFCRGVFTSGRNTSLRHSEQAEKAAKDRLLIMAARDALLQRRLPQPLAMAVLCEGYPHLRSTIMTLESSAQAELIGSEDTKKGMVSCGKRVEGCSWVAWCGDVDVQCDSCKRSMEEWTEAAEEKWEDTVSCPVCGELFERGDNVDRQISEHIDSGCEGRSAGASAPAREEEEADSFALLSAVGQQPRLSQPNLFGAEHDTPDANIRDAMLREPAVLPYGGDVNAAMRAQDRAAIREIMAARDAPGAAAPAGHGDVRPADAATVECLLPTAQQDDEATVQQVHDDEAIARALQAADEAAERAAMPAFLRRLDAWASS